MTEKEVIDALVNEESIYDTKNKELYIPDVSVEPYRYHGFQILRVKISEQEILEKIKKYSTMEMWALDEFPAPGTAAPNKLLFRALDDYWFPDDDDRDETEEESRRKIERYVSIHLEPFGICENMMVATDYIKKLKAQIPEIRYALDMSEEQARITKGALEFYARVLIGQWGELSELCLNIGDEDYLEKKEKLDAGLANLRQIAFSDLPKSLSASYGITKVSRATEAWEIYQVLRHRIAWTMFPEGSWSVDFQPPISFSGKELPTCTSKKRRGALIRRELI